MATPEAALKLEIARLTGIVFPLSRVDVFSQTMYQVLSIVIDPERVKHVLLTQQRARPTSTPRISRHHREHTFAQDTRPPVLTQPQVQAHLM